MGIGGGILLIVIGAILLFALNVNLPFVSDDTLGIILIVAGFAVIVLSLVLARQRGRTRHVEERYDTGTGNGARRVEERHEGPPPAV
jgi:hypothetical protein